MKKSFLILSILLFCSKINGQNGLIGEYYNGVNFEAKVYTRFDKTINFNWDKIAPLEGLNDNHFSIKWFGKIIAPETGEYLIGVLVDDGLKVWINDKLIIDSWGPNNKVLFERKYFMEKGKLYDIKIDYNNTILEGVIELKWQIPSKKDKFYLFKTNYEIITQNYFTDISLNKTEVKVQLKSNPIETKTEPIKPQLIVKPKVIKNTPPKDSIDKYIPKNILFIQSTAVMIGKSEEELLKLYSFLKKFPQLKISIEGHTDSFGDTDLNLKLSEERAITVMDYLIKLGINKERLKAKGFGGTKPLNNVKSKISQNRRVEFIIE